MALSTLETLQHRLQAAGLTSGVDARLPHDTGTKEMHGRRSTVAEESDLAWWSGAKGSPFFISPKHDGVRLVSYVPPPPPLLLPASTPTSRRRKKRAAVRSANSLPRVDASSTPPPTTSYSRHGRPIYGLFWIEEELRLLRALCGDASLIVDGELYLHNTEMSGARATAAASSLKKGGGIAKAPPLTSPLRRQRPRKRPDMFVTGFLAVSALVHRLRGSSSACATEQDVLQYVPTLPRLCVFDIPSFSPPPGVFELPSRSRHAGAHLDPLLFSEALPKDDQTRRRIVAEVERIRGQVMIALHIQDVEQLRIIPNVTLFPQRLRTAHFLFELLSRGVASPVLRHHFCPTWEGHGGNTKTRAGAAAEAGGAARYHGGGFVSLIPHELVPSLEDALQRVLPAYMKQGYEGAVVRAPVNAYEFKEKTKGSIAALTAPLLQSSEEKATVRYTRRGGGRGKKNGGGEEASRKRDCAALLLSLNSSIASDASASCVIVRAYEGGKSSREPQWPVSGESTGLSDVELNDLDVAAVRQRAVQAGTKLSPRSRTAMKLLTYQDREYAILRPLLKEPSTNPNTRRLVSIPRSQVRHLRYLIKSNTQHTDKTVSSTVSSADPKSPICFYGLECLAENGLVFHVSLPKLTLQQQQALLRHLLSAGREGIAKKSSKVTDATDQKMASLTGLYATVKFNTLTENGLPRFGAVKSIRGGKGWFM